MKNLILAIVVALMMCSCEIEKKKAVNRIPGDTYNTQLLELSANGKTHEFIKYSSGKFNNGIAHWPDCKYCKK